MSRHQSAAQNHAIKKIEQILIICGQLKALVNDTNISTLH